MRFGTWNVRSLYRAGSLRTVSRDVARYKLDLSMKLLGIISVGFDITDQLQIRFSAFVRYWSKNWRTMRQYISYS
jgi:hypothetical protein